MINVTTLYTHGGLGTNVHVRMAFGIKGYDTHIYFDFSSHIPGVSSSDYNTEFYFMKT